MLSVPAVRGSQGNFDLAVRHLRNPVLCPPQWNHLPIFHLHFLYSLCLAIKHIGWVMQSHELWTNMAKGHPQVGWAPIGFAVAAPWANLPEGIVLGWPLSVLQWCQPQDNLNTTLVIPNFVGYSHVGHRENFKGCQGPLVLIEIDMAQRPCNQLLSIDPLHNRFRIFHFLDSQWLQILLMFISSWRLQLF